MISAILLAFAGLCNANMDALKFRWGRYRFADKLYHYAGPNSWKNKYKNNDPEAGPRFPGSTTFFVFVTDLWHLSQMLWRVSMTLAIVLYKPILPSIWYDLIPFTASYLIMFNIGFHYVFVCKK